MITTIFSILLTIYLNAVSHSLDEMRKIIESVIRDFLGGRGETKFKPREVTTKLDVGIEDLD